LGIFTCAYFYTKDEKEIEARVDKRMVYCGFLNAHFYFHTKYIYVKHVK